MDYHVLILSRVREGVDRGLSTDDAVRQGIAATAGTVTSAAVVMVAVFSIFATLSVINMKEMGVGLAAAVLIDAAIVRDVLLPAAMKLLGERNWYLPRSLRWLPEAREPEPARRRVRAGLSQVTAAGFLQARGCCLAGEPGESHRREAGAAGEVVWPWLASTWTGWRRSPKGWRWASTC